MTGWGWDHQGIVVLFSFRSACFLARLTFFFFFVFDFELCCEIYDFKSKMNFSLPFPILAPWNVNWLKLNSPGRNQIYFKNKNAIERTWQGSKPQFNYVKQLFIQNLNQNRWNLTLVIVPTIICTIDEILFLGSAAAEHSGYFLASHLKRRWKKTLPKPVVWNRWL